MQLLRVAAFLDAVSVTGFYGRLGLESYGYLTPELQST